eukprot:1132130-Amphidinium_carterae.1
MVWLCVLTYEADQGPASPEAPPSPRTLRTCESAHPKLQKMLRANTTEAPAPEGMGPPPTPKQPQEVVLQESPAWQKSQAEAAPRDESPRVQDPTKGGTPPQQTHSGPIKPLKQEPKEPQQDAWNQGGQSRRRDHTPRRSPEAPVSELSAWSGTTRWGGSSANSSRDRSSLGKQGKNWKDRSPSRKRNEAGQASSSQAEGQAEPKQRKRPHSTRRVLLSIPAAVAELVMCTQRVAVEMVAGRCRKATAKLLQQSIEGFKKRYPEVPTPGHEDYEFFSFLRDRQLEYPEVWEVPVWFRRATLLASAEEEKQLRPLVEGGKTYLVRKTTRAQEESDEGELPATSPASVPGGPG